MNAEQIMKSILLDTKKDGIQQVFFVGCGGSLAGLYPAWYLLSREAKTLRAAYYNSSEFLQATPAACGPSSLVICCSLMDTPETVEACRRARALNAQVIALVGSDNSQMVQIAPYSICYRNFDARKRDTNASETKLAWALRLAFELLWQKEGYAAYPQAMEGFEMLNDIVLAGLRYSDRRAPIFAQKAENETMIYVMGSGANNGAMYASSVCNLLECMWTDSIAVNTGEYFHGPFETTDQNLAVMLMVGTGRTRALDERALRFLNRYCDNLTVIDSKTFGIDRIAPSVREYFDPLVFMPVMDIYNTALARLRGHCEQDRRYMHKVAY